MDISARDLIDSFDDDSERASRSRIFYWLVGSKRLRSRYHSVTSEGISTFFRINFPRDFPYSLRNKKRRSAESRLKNTQSSLVTNANYPTAQSQIVDDYSDCCGYSSTSIEPTPPGYLSLPFDQGTLYSTAIKVTQDLDGPNQYPTGYQRRPTNIWHAFKYARKKFKRLQRRRSDIVHNNHTDGQSTAAKTLQQVLREIKFLDPEPFYIGKRYNENTIPMDKWLNS